ncbi:TPA: hypothetical protein ACTNZV_004743, partial [Escherichia coli]
MKQSAGNINDKTSRFFRQTNNISKYDSSRRGKKFFTCTILKKMEMNKNGATYLEGFTSDREPGTKTVCRSKGPGAYRQFNSGRIIFMPC